MNPEMEDPEIDVAYKGIQMICITTIGNWKIQINQWKEEVKAIATQKKESLIKQKKRLMSHRQISLQKENALICQGKLEFLEEIKKVQESQYGDQNVISRQNSERDIWEKKSSARTVKIIVSGSVVQSD